MFFFFFFFQAEDGIRDFCLSRGLGDVYKRQIQNVYGAEPYKLEDMLAWCKEFGEKLAPYICNTTKYMYDAQAAGKNIMFEAQLGALRDIDFGIFPYTCLLYTSPSPRDRQKSRMPSSA